MIESDVVGWNSAEAGMKVRCQRRVQNGLTCNAAFVRGKILHRVLLRDSNALRNSHGEILDYHLLWE